MGVSKIWNNSVQKIVIFFFSPPSRYITVVTLILHKSLSLFYRLTISEFGLVALKSQMDKYALLTSL